MDSLPWSGVTREQRSTVPDETSTRIDREQLRTYLNDHLSGATGVLHRLERMADSYPDLPVHPDIVRLRDDVRTERRRLRAVIRSLGLGLNLPKQALARVGELAGRLKLNGRVLPRSPLSPLLELELLQSGVSAKSGLWRVLAAHAPSLGLDPQEFRRLEEQAEAQVEAIVRAHRTMLVDAFRPEEA
jgi:hypothetical protein